MNNYKLINKIPSVEDYMNLRENTLGKKTLKEAKSAIENTWHGVYVVDGEKTVGIGRIVGDSGATFVLTDICVLPNYQGHGIGSIILESLVNYYKENAPKNAFFTLLAKGDAKYLYKKFGFLENPEFTGMIFKN